MYVYAYDLYHLHQHILHMLTMYMVDVIYVVTFWWITWGNFNPFIAERQFYESFSFGHFITLGLIWGTRLN
jgi:hypothetical protein